MSDGLHRLAELRSLAYHRELADRLAAGDRALFERGRRKLAEWVADQRIHAHYGRLWEKAFRDEALMSKLLTADDEESRAARQCSPFPGCLSPRRRRALWASVRRDWLRQRAEGGVTG